MWYLVRGANLVFPVLLIVFITADKLAAYLLLVQFFQVIGQVSSSAIISSYVDKSLRYDVVGYIFSNLLSLLVAIFICVFVSLLFAHKFEIPWYSIFSISLFFAFKIYLQTALKRSVEETRVIFFGDLCYSIAIFFGILVWENFSVIFLSTLILNISLLLVFVRGREVTIVDEMPSETISKVLQRMWSYSCLTVIFSLATLILMSFIAPDLIISLKLSIVICTPIIWLQASVKASFLKEPDITSQQALDRHLNRIIFATLFCFLSIAGVYILTVTNFFDLGSKLKSDAFLLLSFSMFMGSMFLLYTTIRVGPVQWEIYTGSMASKLAVLLLIYIAALTLVLNYNSSFVVVSFMLTLMFVYNGICLKLLSSMLNKKKIRIREDHGSI